MKPASPHRLRRTLLILGACWMALSTAWVARRWYAVRIVEAAAPLSAWEQPAWASFTGARLLPTSRLAMLSLDYHPPNGAQLAWAVRVCGPFEILQVVPADNPGMGDPEQTRVFLRALGRQESVETLKISCMENLTDSSAALTAEEIPAVLERFPRVRSLHLQLPGCFGIRFPLLPALRDVTFEDTPISGQDLQWVLRCPALRTCVLDETIVTVAGVRQVADWRQKALRKFTLKHSHLRKAEIEEMRAIMSATCPDVETTISNGANPQE